MFEPIILALSLFSPTPAEAVMFIQTTSVSTTTTTTLPGTPPTVLSRSGYNGGIGTISLTDPSGYQNGDLGFVVIEVDGDDTAGISTSGWTELAQVRSGTTASGDSTLAVFWRVGAGGNNNIVTTDSGNHQTAGHTSTVNGTWSGSPEVHVSATDTQTSSTSSRTLPSVTTTRKGCVVFAALSIHNDGANNNAMCSGWSAGWTEQLDHRSGNGNGGTFCVASKDMPSAGASGAVSVTTVDSGKGGEITWAVCE